MQDKVQSISRTVASLSDDDRRKQLIYHSYGASSLEDEVKELQNSKRAQALGYQDRLNDLVQRHDGAINTNVSQQYN